MAACFETLDGDLQVATSVVHKKNWNKDRNTLARRKVWCRTFDDKIRHYGNHRITGLHWLSMMVQR